MQPTDISKAKDRAPTLTSILAPIRDELDVVEAVLRSTAPDEYAPLAEVIQHIVSGGGKRVRPALVLLATKFYPVEFDKVVSLAAAVETLHTATLIHDDVVDDSMLRRGRPTINAVWQDGATVLAGDYVFARAAGFAAATGSVRVIELFAEALKTIVDGELRQLFRRRDGLPSREEYYRRIFSKTASLFTLATEASGVLMAAPEQEVQALHEYGYYLGVAFQIIDDVLDFIGDEVQLGKPIGSDLRQGTVTLPVHLFAADQPEHPALQNYLHGGNDDGSVADLVEAVRSSTAIEGALAEASELAERANAELAPLPDAPARSSLRDLAQYVVRRRQ
jgi:octaprenyl-diphosphate synthase